MFVFGWTFLVLGDHYLLFFLICYYFCNGLELLLQINDLCITNKLMPFGCHFESDLQGH